MGRHSNSSSASEDEANDKTKSDADSASSASSVKFRSTTSDAHSESASSASQSSSSSSQSDSNSEDSSPSKKKNLGKEKHGDSSPDIKVTKIKPGRLRIENTFSDSHDGASKDSEGHSPDGGNESGKLGAKEGKVRNDEGGVKKSRTESIRDIIRSSSAASGSQLSIKKLAAEQPDLYGIRRSGRQRKEVSRLNISKLKAEHRRSGRDGGRRRRISSRTNSSQSDVSSDDDDEPAPRRRMTRARYAKEVASSSEKRQQRGRKRRQSSSRSSTSSRHDDDDDDEEEEAATTSNEDEDDDDESEKETKRRRKASASRTKSTKKRSKARATSKGKALKKRATKQKVCYKEESDDVTDSDDLIEIEPTEEDQERETAETIEKIIRKRIGRKGATGSKTAMYISDVDGDPNVGLDADKEETEVQYLIKWKGWSHIHNTWESEASLNEQKVNGLKKLENFIQREADLDRWRNYANPEDIEYYDCQQEMMEDLNQQYSRVERIVMHHPPKPGCETFDYLVKWQGLPYSECTQEDSDLICKRYPEAVEEYECRQKNTCSPNKNCKALKTRPKFVTLKDQPSYIGGGGETLKLRDYQLEGLNWLLHSWCKENGAILADEMGLGKTIQTIAFLAVLIEHYHVYGPFLIIVPLSTLVTWQREFQTWAPHINVIVYIGDIKSRSTIREYEWTNPTTKKMKFNVVITTYEILLKDKGFLGGMSWAVLAVDEAHRLKNDDSLLYKSLVTFDTNHRLFITGTPLQNSLRELWSLLHFIMPQKFEYWDEFEKRHSAADKTGFRSLHQELEPFLLRRVKKDVEKSLPAKVEQILRVELSKVQKQYYRWILTKNYKALTKGLKGNISGFLNIMMELKKCCNHAFLVRPPDHVDDPNIDRFELLVKSSGKLILLDKLLLRLKEAGHRVLIFSQMVRLLDILAEYLQLRHFQYQRLDGTIRGDVRKQAMDHFNAEGSTDFCFLLSTRAGGLGVNLATADTVIIFDSDWNPQNDLQAQARAHRIGQKNQVSVYRLVTKNSVEEDIVERAKKKMVLDHLVIQRMDTTGRTILDKAGLSGQSSINNPFNKEELNAILKFGAEELFKEADDEEELQVDIDDILRLAETRNTEELKNSATDELLSQFKVVSFDNLEDQELEGRSKLGTIRDWDDIIPEDDRKKMDEEEVKRQLQELNLPPRSRKQVNDVHLNIYDSGDESHSVKKKRGGRGGRGGDEGEESESSEDESEEEGAEKTGRRKSRVAGGRKGSGEQVKGFTDAEIRRFIKSFKKFCRPKERLDDVAGDAELQEKSHADLLRLVERLLAGCEQTMKDHEERVKEQHATATAESPVKKSAPLRASFKLSNVTVNAKAIMQAMSELEPLAAVMPIDPKERVKYQILGRLRGAHFDCMWDNTDDSNLLRGVYEYGLGNWESIKMDVDLGLHDKILSEGELKPQGKHLQSRAEYLLKILQKQNELASQDSSQHKSPRKRAAAGASSGRSSKKIKSRETVDDNMDGSDEESLDAGATKEGGSSKHGGLEGDGKIKRDRSKGTGGKEKATKGGEKKASHHKLKKPDLKKKSSGSVGPLHFTTNQTVSVDEEGVPILPPEVFKECKERMRRVKKSLKRLGTPDLTLSEKEQLNNTKSCLLKIGNHISELLSEYKDPDVIKEWRSFLWVFVSKFTEFDANRLYKLYKHMVKKQEDDKSRKELDKKNKRSPRSTLHYGDQPPHSNNQTSGYPSGGSGHDRKYGSQDNKYGAHPGSSHGNMCRSGGQDEHRHDKKSRAEHNFTPTDASGSSKSSSRFDHSPMKRPRAGAELSSSSELGNNSESIRDSSFRHPPPAVVHPPGGPVTSNLYSIPPPPFNVPPPSLPPPVYAGGPGDSLLPPSTSSSSLSESDYYQSGGNGGDMRDGRRDRDDRRGEGYSRNRYSGDGVGRGGGVREGRGYGRPSHYYNNNYRHGPQSSDNKPYYHNQQQRYPPQNSDPVGGGGGYNALPPPPAPGAGYHGGVGRSYDDRRDYWPSGPPDQPSSSSRNNGGSSYDRKSRWHHDDDRGDSRGGNGGSRRTRTPPRERLPSPPNSSSSAAPPYHYGSSIPPLGPPPLDRGWAMPLHPLPAPPTLPPVGPYGGYPGPPPASSTSSSSQFQSFSKNQ